MTLEPAALATRVKVSTTEPLRSLVLDVPYKRIRDMDLQSAAKKSKSTLTDLVSQQPKNDPEKNSLDIIPSLTKREEDQFLEELNRCLPSSAVSLE